jgi:pimeloyl-ACP methyl ester carboxylesterase
MQLAATDFPAVINKLLPKMLHPAHLGDESIVDTFTAMARSVGSDAFVRQQMAIMGRIDSRPSLSRIGCPTLVLCGRDDTITPVEVHEEMIAAIPGAHLAIVEECGHLSALEQPERVAAALRFWIEKIPVA